MLMLSGQNLSEFLPSKYMFVSDLGGSTYLFGEGVKESEIVLAYTRFTESDEAPKHDLLPR
jgi:hypothetical protein